MAKFHEFSSNYDHFMGMYQKTSEELDTLRAKV